MGFCWGGGIVNSLATASPDLNAGVVFYGRTPPLEDVPKIHAKLLLNYAGLDDRINEGLPGIEGGAEKANVDYTLHIYQGANHAFNNDTNPARYTRRLRNWHGAGPLISEGKPCGMIVPSCAWARRLNSWAVSCLPT